MVVESGETTTQALARSRSAAARIVRSAVPGSGVRAYRVLMECKVRTANTFDAFLAYVDKWANKIIGEKGLFRQFILGAKFSGKSVVPRQFEPAPPVTIVNEGGFIATDLHAIVEDRIGVRVTEELVS